MAENDPQIYQRFVHGVQKHGHLLDEAVRAAENARHSKSVGDRWSRRREAALAIVAFVAVVAVIYVLYQVTGGADAVPSSQP